MNRFSQHSMKELLSCRAELQRVLRAALRAMDFAVLEGHRTHERQEYLYSIGASHVRAGQSKHNVFPSMAADIAPSPIDWTDTDRFTLLAGIVIGIASQEGTAIRWGGDWDGDRNLKEERFRDLGHFELIG